MIVRTLIFEFDDDAMRREYRDEIIGDSDVGYTGTEDTWVSDIVEDVLREAEESLLKGLHTTVRRSGDLPGALATCKLALDALTDPLAQRLVVLAQAATAKALNGG